MRQTAHGLPSSRIRTAHLTCRAAGSHLAGRASRAAWRTSLSRPWRGRPAALRPAQGKSPSSQQAGTARRAASASFASSSTARAIFKSCELRSQLVDPRGGPVAALLVDDRQEGGKSPSSPDSCSLMPKSMLVPSNSVLRTSVMMDPKVASATPPASSPTRLGRKRTSGHRKRSQPTAMMFPSGSPRPEPLAAALSSATKSRPT